ncbi:unnamed protein product [Prunus armeniaca]
MHINARDHISAAGVSFEDDDIVILALNGLPSDYNTFRCMVRGRENVLSLKDFRSQLIAEEATLEQTNSASPFVSAMMAQNQTFQGKALVLDEGISNSQPQGYPFGSKSASSSHFPSGFNGVLMVTMLVSMVPIMVSMVTTLVVTLSIVGLILRVEAEVAVIINMVHALIKFSLLLALVADTGATTHMTSDLSQLSLATPFSGSDTITTTGGSGLSISNIGSSILDVPLCSLQLKQDKITGSVLLKGLCRAGLYPIPFSLPQSNLQQASSFHKNHFCYLGQRVNTSLWHKRLGHPSNTITSALLRQYKGYICFSLQTNRFFVTRHVIFDETMFPYTSVHAVSIPPSQSPTTSSQPLISLHNTILSPVSSLHVSSSSSSTSTATESLNTLLPSASECLLSTSQNMPILESATQSPLPVDPDFQPETLCVVLPLLVVNLHPMTTMSKNGISKRKAYSASVQPVDYSQVEPSSFKATSSNGSIARHKACLAAKGFSQEEGIDYSETFSPVVKHTTVRLVLALAAQFNWSLRQLDVKNAFLHGILQEEVYMTQPQGFESKLHPSDFVYPSLFVQQSSLGTVILLLYVDDIILTGSHSSLFTSVIAALTQEFDMNDLGQLNYFLGLQISYQSTGLFVTQTKYIKELLDKVDLQDSKPCATPCLPYHILLKDDGKPYSHPKQHRSIVGALQYLTFTRPDIAFSVNQACQFMHNPMESYVVAVKRILRYLKGTLDFGIHFQPGILNLQAYSDVDWAGDPNDRRSVSGYIVYLGSSPISWASKKQHIVSRSSTGAEYRALAIAATELAWIRQLFCDLRVSLHIPPLIHCDNISAISLASNPVFHSRMKHLQIDYHFVKERVIRGVLLVQHVSFADQFADILTKGLSTPLFQHQCSNLMLGSSKPAIEGECKDINGPSLATCHKIKESSG